LPWVVWTKSGAWQVDGFESIHHEILKGLLSGAIKCRPTLDLAARIIDASNPQEEANWYYPGDNLFTPYERRRGLPLGNQTSQFFANVYLNPLDQMVGRSLRPDVYVRYVDDFLLFSDCKDRLDEMQARIEEELCSLRLTMHARKSRVYRTAEGFTFLGWRIYAANRNRNEPENRNDNIGFRCARDVKRRKRFSTVARAAAITVAVGVRLSLPDRGPDAGQPVVRRQTSTLPRPFGSRAAKIGRGNLVNGQKSDSSAPAQA
jgi:hypothetical protein